MSRPTIPGPGASGAPGQSPVAPVELARGVNSFVQARDAAETEEKTMKLVIDVPPIGECTVTACAYNRDLSCHAQAITIGSGVHPACDTFLASSEHVQDTSHVAGVGACKVASCRYNEDLECRAERIAVAHHGGHADCATFAPASTGR
jgi:hypothetical protein